MQGAIIQWKQAGEAQCLQRQAWHQESGWGHNQWGWGCMATLSTNHDASRHAFRLYDQWMEADVSRMARAQCIVRMARMASNHAWRVRG
eukprot:6208826-Pleurochrysis_carterae.AAC.2